MDGAASTAWDTNTANWYNTTSSTADKFYSGDAVTFDNTAGTASSVTIAGTVQPATITVNNGAVNFTFSGPGAIGGASTLAKTGTGSLTISNSNTYSGGTTLSNGLLVANATGALGTGALTQSGGTLNLNAAQSVSSTALGGGVLNINVIGGSGNGAFTVTGGTLDNTSGSTVTLTNNALSWNGNFAFGGSNPLNSGTGAVTLSGSPTIAVSGTGVVTIGGVIGGSGQEPHSGGARHFASRRVQYVQRHDDRQRRHAPAWRWHQRPQRLGCRRDRRQRGRGIRSQRLDHVLRPDLRWWRHDQDRHGHAGTRGQQHL